MMFHLLGLKGLFLQKIAAFLLSPTVGLASFFLMPGMTVGNAFDLFLLALFPPFSS